MARYSDAERELRAEYTRQRDILHKRVQRAIASGKDLTGTALERYVKTNPDGNQVAAIPTLREIDAEVANKIAGGTLDKGREDAYRAGRIEKTQGQMSRTIDAPTGSLQGINAREEEFKNFLEGRGLVELSDEEVETVGEALDIAESMGIAGFSYDEVISATIQLRGDREENIDLDAESLARRALENMVINSPGRNVLKQSVSLYFNVKNSPDRQSELKSAMTRLNNALRKYGGK